MSDKKTLVEEVQMTHSYLNEDDSFARLHSNNDKTKAFFFGRRLGHQVSSEMDETFFLILKRLDISPRASDNEITDDDVEKLKVIEESMAELIIDICRRKAC